MAIKQVRAKINGSWYVLTSTDGRTYKATVTAPSITSYNLPGKYYNVDVEATNTAGTTGTASGATLAGLRLVVKERIKPTITVLSPTPGAHVTNNKQPIVFNVTDEVNGSGINLSSITIGLENNIQISYGDQFNAQAIQNGYTVTWTPKGTFKDGKRHVEISVADNDGNSADTYALHFTVDTVPPTLSVTSPSEGLITNNSKLNIAGTTNDATSSPVKIAIVLNGSDVGAVTVDSSGHFTKLVTLREGSNTIKVTATDSAGKQSVITRTVTLDTTVPKIVSAKITPNPVDAGKTMVIEVVIE